MKIPRTSPSVASRRKATQVTNKAQDKGTEAPSPSEDEEVEADTLASLGPVLGHDPAAYVEAISLRKYGNNYRIRYMSPLSGKMKRRPLKITGRFLSRELAEAWAEEHLPRIIEAELVMLERQRWRTYPVLCKRVNEYKAFKLKKAPRSARQDLSMLTNLVLPYFAVEQELKDPREWFLRSKRFKAWLLNREEGAKTAAGEPISVSTANKAINSLNKFGEWLVDFEYINEADYRPLKAYSASMQNKKGADDLVDEQEFHLVRERLRKDDNPLWAELWLVQYWTGMRINELVGLTLNFLSPEAPQEVHDVITAAGLPIYGAILLDSQPAQDHIKRIGQQIPRTPLKWRDKISPRNSRVIPVVNKEVWNILARRHEEQMKLYDRAVWGDNPAQYLLFEGAQKLKYTMKIMEAYERVGLTPKGSHSLRHTRITAWTALSIPDKIMELIFGNKAQAREGYIHLVEVLNRKAQEKTNLTRIRVVG